MTTERYADAEREAPACWNCALPGRAKYFCCGPDHPMVMWAAEIPCPLCAAQAEAREPARVPREPDAWLENAVDANRWRKFRDDFDLCDALHMIADGTAHFDATIDAAIANDARPAAEEGEPWPVDGMWPTDKLPVGPPQTPSECAPATELERWGIKYQGPRDPHCVLMRDGYWTPWHIAAATIERLQAEIAQVEELSAHRLRLFHHASDRADKAEAENAQLRETVERQAKVIAGWEEAWDAQTASGDLGNPVGQTDSERA